MAKVGIIGANSQVAAEVALFLSMNYKVELVCFLRSEYSAALLKVASINVVITDYQDAVHLEKSLGDCDIVVDFTYPAGQLTSILPEITKLSTLIMQAVKPNTKYIYMSSIMAFGMPNGSLTIKEYSLPRTSYSYIKRQAEKRIRRLGQAHNIQVYIFRLGQVHGVLQSVTQEFTDRMASGVVHVRGDKSELTNIIFACSLSEAIMKCIHDRVPEGLYTLVSSPQWTQEQLYQFYQEWSASKATIQYGSAGATGRSSLRRRVLGSIWKYLLPFRSILETYVLLRFPAKAAQIKGSYRIRAVEQEINALQKQPDESQHNLLGATPGIKLSNIPSSPEVVLQSQKGLEHALNAAIDRMKK